MKDIIIDRLGKIEDLEQRKLLKNIMAGFFSNLIDYQETMNKNLEARVFNEIEDIEKKYDLYVTVCRKVNVDPTDTFLYPVFAEEMDDEKYDITELIKKLNLGEEVPLFSVFMECDYTTLQEIIKCKKTFKGQVKTENKSYSIDIKIRQSKRYIDEIEKLYNTFQSNNIPWKTVNNPYANRFFDVVLVGCEGFFDENDEISEININLKEYEAYKVHDAVLMWNVERMKIKSDGFPMPAIDRINYEHEVSLKKLGMDHGYLVVDNEDMVKYVNFTSETLTIVSPREKASEWNILRVVKCQGSENRRVDYPLESNCRKNSFVTKFAHKQSALIRTRGEIMRIVNSFEASQNMELLEIKVEDYQASESITYDTNFFVADDIRVGNDKKVMKLKFKKIYQEKFTTYDILSFLVSEVQMYFPEYKCEGEFI